MKFNPSEPRPYVRRGATQPGRWEVDMRGTLDNGLEVTRERRVFPLSSTARVGKRQAAAMAFEEWQRWNRHGQVLRAGHNPPPARDRGTAPATPPTFAQFESDFLEFCASPSASPRGSNRPATLACKRQVLRDHVIPTFGSLRMDQLTSRDIDRFVIEQTKKGLKPNTIAKSTMVVRRMLVVAKRHGLIEVVPEVRSPAPTRGTVKALDPDEAARFLSVLPEVYGDRRALLLELYLRTGMRLGEGLGLYPRDFDLDAATPTVRISRSFTRFGYGRTKGGKPRTVPLTRRLAAQVDDHFAERGLSPKDSVSPVFCALGDPERPEHRTRVHEWADDAAKAAKIQHVHPHMLRHTFGTECARRGVPVLTIKEWMGHASIDTTMVYVHLVAPDHLRWAGLLGE